MKYRIKKSWAAASLALLVGIGGALRSHATDGYVAFIDAASNEPRIQRWHFDSIAMSYTLVGNPIGAAPAGKAVMTLEVNPRTGEIYTQTTDNALRRWSHDGVNFTNLGSIGNDGALGFTISDDDSIYALNGPSPFGTGPEWLIKFNRQLTVNQYFVGVAGQDIVAVGNDVYVGANDIGGSIIHFRDTGSAFAYQGYAPFPSANELTLNPAKGNKYAAANGFDKATGSPDNTIAWIITGSLSDIAVGKWDANNVGTGWEFVNDLEAGPDGTIFGTQRGPGTTIRAWIDNGPLGTPSTPSAVGNNNADGAWLAIDPLSSVSSTIIHTATNESSAFLRTWKWNGAGLSFAGHFAIPGASKVTEIAVIAAAIPEPSAIGLASACLAALARWRGTRVSKARFSGLSSHDPQTNCFGA